MLNYDPKKLFYPVASAPCMDAPHHAPHSMPEKVDELARKLRDTLDRLSRYEDQLTAKYDDLMRNMSADNVTFKKLMEDGWKDFVSTVRAEVNLFESTIESTIKLFEQGTDVKLDEHLAIVEAAELFMKQNISASLETLLHEMEDAGQLPGVIDSAIMVNVKHFGATGDGSTDDSAAFIEAFNALSTHGGVVYVPDGVYKVSVNIPVPSNTTIRGGSQSVVKREATDLDHYQVFDVTGKSNVHFESLMIVGDRHSHIGTSGEWGMGISFTGAEDCTVENCCIMDCWGDGIYIGSFGSDPCYNIRVLNCTIDYNRRNGISVINVDGLTVSGCEIRNTEGTAPQNGICFECNDDTDAIRNATVNNCIFRNNAKYGVGITGGSNLYEITIEGCTFNAHNGVYVARTMVEGLGGQLIIRNNVFRSALGIAFDAKTPEGMPVIISGCQFFVSGTGIRIGYSELNEERIIGGIVIQDCLFGAWGSTVWPIEIRCGSNANASYRDIFIDARYMPVAHSMTYISAPKTGTAYIAPDHYSAKNLNGDTTLGGTGLFTVADVNCATANRKITLAETVPFGTEFKFRIIGPNTLTFECSDGLFAQSGKANVAFTGQYTEIIIRHEAANRWSYRKING